MVNIQKFEMQKLDDEVAFTRLVSVLENGYLQNGMPKSTATRLKHVSFSFTLTRKRQSHTSRASCDINNYASVHLVAG